MSKKNRLPKFIHLFLRGGKSKKCILILTNLGYQLIHDHSVAIQYTCSVGEHLDHVMFVLMFLNTYIMELKLEKKYLTLVARYCLQEKY